MLAILTTHPIQYQVPLWQALAKEGSVPFEVWYLTDHGTHRSYDEQFGKAFAWDLDTLSGYPHRFIRVNQGASVNRFKELRLTESLVTLFKEKNVSALWVQGWQVMAYWQAVWQAHRAGVQVWLRGESNDLAPPPSSIIKRSSKRFMLSQLFSRIDHFLCIGQANRRLYKSYGVREEQLHSAPYGVDNDRFANQFKELEHERIKLRREWNIPDDAFCVLFAGKFIPKKRPLDLAAAAISPRLKHLGRPLHLLFVGSGELDRPLRERCKVVFDAESLNVEAPDNGNVYAERPTASFAGFLNQKEISKAYVAADCLALPSNHLETWGLVVNEAMASGLPCIASDACGCTEDLVLPVCPSFSFPVGDIEGIADALLEVFAGRVKPAPLKSRVQLFSLSKSVETVCNLYHSSISS